MKNGKLGVAVIGGGSIAQHAHLPNYAANPNVELLAVVEPIADRAEAITMKYPNTRVVPSTDDLFGMADVDLVSVCLPNFLHAPVTIAALQAGKHVLCEKPPATNAQDAHKMADAAKAAGRILTFGFHQRFRADSQALKKIIDDGQLGDIYYIKTGNLRRTGIPGMGSWFTQRQQAGGGPLYDIGVHMLDLSLYLTGFPRGTTVKGSTFAQFGPRGKAAGGWGFKEDTGKFDVEDLATALITFDNGATMLLDAGWASFSEGDSGYMQLLGTEGGANLVPLKLYQERDGKQVTEAIEVARVNAYAAEIDQVVEAVRAGRQPLATPEQGIKVMEILDAIYASAASGHEVAIG